MKITKRESCIVKGIAILLMYAHHLFVFPERISANNLYEPTFNFINLEYQTGAFGRICVFVFLFLSGLGFGESNKTSFKYYIDKVFRFYRTFWFYFLIFISIGFVWFHLKLPGNILSVISELLGLTVSYNYEWWFVEPYIILVLLSFFIIRLLQFNSILLFIISVTGFIVHFFIKYTGAIIELKSILYLQLPFVMGALYPKIKTMEFSKKWNTFIVPVLCLLLSIVLWQSLHAVGLLIATPFFVYACVRIFRNIPWVSNVLWFLGTYSMPMWLIHTFFCYYYWQSLIYYPHNGFLIFFNLTLITLICSWVLESVRVKIFSILDKPQKRSSGSLVVKDKVNIISKSMENSEKGTFKVF